MTWKCLIQAKHALATQATQYTAGSLTVIDKFTATNTNPSTAVTLSVHIVPSGGSANSQNRLIQEVSIEPGKAYLCGELPGHILEVGDFISTIASVASSIVIRASGRIA